LFNRFQVAEHERDVVIHLLVAEVGHVPEGDVAEDKTVVLQVPIRLSIVFYECLA